MEVPQEISSLIDRINKSEDRWKAQYMAFWQHAGFLEEKYGNTPEWDKPGVWLLPSFKKKYHTYTPNELSQILKSFDIEFTLEHLIILFSLFEVLLKEASLTLFSEELRADKWESIKKFFEGKNTKNILNKSEMEELELAKCTRNCYAHNGNKIDEKWLEAYKRIRGNPIAQNKDRLNEGIPNFYHQVEDWHDLIVKVSHKIKHKIEENPNL